jgi:hypothetical protein
MEMKSTTTTTITFSPEEIRLILLDYIKNQDLYERKMGGKITSEFQTDYKLDENSEYYEPVFIGFEVKIERENE